MDLTKNPKDLVKDAGKAINKATPDLSEAPGPYDTAREQRDEANVSPLGFLMLLSCLSVHVCMRRGCWCQCLFGCDIDVRQDHLDLALYGG